MWYSVRRTTITNDYTNSIWFNSCFLTSIWHKPVSPMPREIDKGVAVMPLQFKRIHKRHPSNSRQTMSALLSLCREFNSYSNSLGVNMLGDNWYAKLVLHRHPVGYKQPWFDFSSFAIYPHFIHSFIHFHAYWEIWNIPSCRDSVNISFFFLLSENECQTKWTAGTATNEEFCGEMRNEKLRKMWNLMKLGRNELT